MHRVRFAPSPTGHLHVGGARTALYDFLFAKHYGGDFVLRIEDTDLERSSEEAMHEQIADLQWLGLDWDEGVEPQNLQDRGKLGPYRQSQRLEIYKEHAQKLIDSGQAYYCFMTDAEMEAQREEAKAKGDQPHIQSPYRDRPLSEAQDRITKGESPVVRFKKPEAEKEYVLSDLVRGEVKFSSNMIGDFVLIRSNGMPVYNFCCSIDDHRMQISHVFRADEHLNNSLRQLMVYEAFGWELPKFGHFSLILGEDKQKLSKRHGATSVNQYRESGFLPEAMNNYLALLGWSHPEEKEILSMEELAQAFDGQRLNPAPAVFDEAKLRWVNATHLRALPNEELWRRLAPYFDQAGLRLPEDSAWRARALDLLKIKMEVLSDAVDLFRPLSMVDLKVSEQGQETLKWESSSAVVKRWKELIEEQSDEYLDAETFQNIQNQVKADCSVKGKFLFMPIRVAVIGQPHGAELKELVPLLTKQTLVQRAEVALSQC